jgi:hypothetical protein
MNNLTKTIVYVVLVVAAIFFGTKFYSNYKGGKVRGETELTEETNAPAAQASTNVAAVTPAQSTNVAGQQTNEAAPAAEGTVATNTPPPTNSVAEQTNPVPETAAQAAAAPDETPVPKKKGGQGSMMAYLGAFLATIVILGLFVAKDVSNLIGQSSIDFLFNDDLKGVHDPEYEQALNAVHSGQYLAAIQMLREFLQKNPSAQYAALEIAEIYEKNLNNHLAAALEYEEVLKKKLPPERWGWAAIHLCNLYSKMDKQDKTIELLRRIVSEHGETAAAKKAAKRLAMYESGGDSDSLASDTPEGMENIPVVPKAAPVAEKPAAAKPALVVKVRGAKAEPKEEAPGSSLPPGFRPK